MLVKKLDRIYAVTCSKMLGTFEERVRRVDPTRLGPIDSQTSDEVDVDDASLNESSE